MISEANFLALTDRQGAALNWVYDLLGNASSPAASTMADELSDLRDLIAALDDDEFELDIDGFVQGNGGMRKAVMGLRSYADQAVVTRGIFTRYMADLEAYFARFGTASVSDSIYNFAYNQNGGATPDWTCLVCPQFALIYYICKGGDPDVWTASYWLSPQAVFSPLIASMGDYNIATTTYGAGTAVDTTKYAEVNPECHVSVSINGTAAVTVTGKNQAGTAGRTWTGTGDSVAAPNTFALTPTVGTDRLREVTGIASVGTATAGTFHVQSIIERSI